MTINRRRFLEATGCAGIVLAARPAFGQSSEPLQFAELRGSLDASSLGLRPGASDDQSRMLSGILEQAAAERKPVFLPPGTYVVSNLRLPDFVHLSGVQGATRLVYGGEGFFLLGEDATHLQFTGLIIDGDNRWMADYASAAIQLRGIDRVLIDDCDVLGSRKHAIALEACGGRISRTTITGAADAAVYSVEATGLRITDNDIADCANGGLLVHRWQAGADHTIVSGNRVARIGARSGGTGQYGNGINVFRAGNVMVANNTVRDCAFSAIRSNSGSDIQIVGNQCLASGETAIYSEFSFEGAVVANNLVDGATTGVSIVNFDQGGRLATVSGNLIRNLTTQGPYETAPPGFGVGIAAEADTTVSGNVIENAPRFGMVIGWGPYLRNVLVNGNIIRNGPVGIAVSVVDGVQATQISNNLFQDMTTGAIFGYRWADAVTGDLAREGSDAFDALTVTGNTVG
ncbi:MAG: TIGR03808 family TAT-translocated repetitive protein [Alphaproteobacteria bacterium]|nr:TIGR03808 family TAT-translocated repetitive protein [Alphaproteobacteria bacterium]